MYKLDNSKTGSFAADSKIAEKKTARLMVTESIHYNVIHAVTFHSGV